jgi:hypothetical protein
MSNQNPNMPDWRAARPQPQKDDVPYFVTTTELESPEEEVL